MPTRSEPMGRVVPDAWQEPAQASRPTRLVPGFGTGAVYWTTISTILGAILFLRFGYAVGHTGIIGALAIVLLGHLVTVPTAMAIAEISTNQRVEGGGVYFMISRSFGLVIGGAIGVALYFSQAISIAFYVIAFGEAFRPVLEAWARTSELAVVDPRIVTIPTVLALGALLRTRGANVGLRALYLVVLALFASLALFFLGPSHGALDLDRATDRIVGGDPFFKVFAICFPAFTGLTAGVGLSGDLRDPRRAIPLGTLAAVITGLVVYVLVALKLGVSATPEELAGDPLVMSRIALWGPIIPIGLACATLSSALGTALVAPRTLQALADDGVLPRGYGSLWLARVRARDNEPLNASAVTFALALVFVVAGDVDFVAQIISMFFMVTYGAICLISFLERFASDPSYRPAFHSRWWISLLGAVLCLILMFGISAPYAALALVLLGAGYAGLRAHMRDLDDPVDLFHGTAFQLSRRLQLWVQRSMRGHERVNWRPAAVCLSDSSFRTTAAFDLLRWIAHRHGFATFIHFIKGYLSRATRDESQEVLERLVRLVDVSDGKIYVDTMVSPSYTSAFTQLIQLPGMTGKENNLVVFDFERSDLDVLERALEHVQLALSTGFDVALLGTAERGFGYRREVHVWLPPGEDGTTNLCVLLTYVITAHPDWEKAQIKLFDVVREDEREERAEELRGMVSSGRLPIARRNISVVAPTDGEERAALVTRHSADADLVVIGLRREMLRRGRSAFEGYDANGNVLYLCAAGEIEIERDSGSRDRAGAEEEESDEGAIGPDASAGEG